jgi:hypothetical protein
MLDGFMDKCQSTHVIRPNIKATNPYPASGRSGRCPPTVKSMIRGTTLLPSHGVNRNMWGEPEWSKNGFGFFFTLPVFLYTPFRGEQEYIFPLLLIYS